MIDNRWYVGCASSRLREGEAVGTRIGAQEIVLFRAEDGLPHALVDRCCHRGFPLSSGRVESGQLQCGYHGWRYDADGKCAHIPSQRAERRVPPVYRVGAFPCIERDTFIWIWIGDQSPTPLRGIPPSADGYWAQGSRRIACNYLLALEITFDLFHVYFVHPSMPVSMRARQHGFVQCTYELRTWKDGCGVYSPPAATHDEPIADNAFKMEFDLPGDIHYAVPSGGQVFHMFFYVTPLDDCSCRMDWLVADGTGREHSERIRWMGDQGDFGEEDRLVLETLQQTYAREGRDFERHVEADAPTLALRRIVRAASQESGQRGNVRNDKRRLFSMATAAH
jgi:phenylpropionate dioxygenase-like ring-hydroxylating dioxygenase large terminal subunit